MKHFVRLALMALLLSFALLFVACDGESPSTDPPSSDSPSEGDTPPVVYLPDFGDNVVDFDSLK